MCFDNDNFRHKGGKGGDEGEDGRKKRNKFSWLVGSLRRRKKNKETLSPVTDEGHNTTATKSETITSLHNSEPKLRDEPISDIECNNSNDFRKYDLLPGEYNETLSKADSETCQSTNQEVSIQPSEEAMRSSPAEDAPQPPVVRLRPHSTTSSRSVRRSGDLRCSKDSLHELGEDLRERLLAWRRSSTLATPQEALEPTFLLPLELSSCPPPACTPEDLVEDQVAQTRLQLLLLSKAQTSTTTSPPALPPKPPLFHLRQLELMQQGVLQPPRPWEPSVLLVTISNLRKAVERPESCYATPRSLRPQE